MFRNPTADVIVVLVIVLLFFGPKRLPLLGRELGRGMREFKESITGERKHHDEDEDEKPAITAAASEPPGSAASHDTPAAQPGRLPADPEPQRRP